MTTTPSATASAAGSPLTIDKVLTEDEIVAQWSDGMTIGLGGWGSRRKPMSVVRAILRSGLRDLTIVSCGGPDVGMLCAAGRVSRLVSAFVSLDVIALEPYFRAARESGRIDVRELDEGMLLLGLQAAAWRVPFLPSRAGLGSDLFRLDPDLRTVVSPYPGPDGVTEELVAVQAIELDAAVVHVNRADRAGNGQILDVDPYFDLQFLGAARQRFITCEELVPTADLTRGGDFRSLAVSRHLVDGVACARGGSHPTSCLPDRPVDVPFMTEYSRSATQDAGWAGFSARWLEQGEAAYQERVSQPAQEVQS
jgi:glutaconate CoA-transferase, subunit A